MQNQPLSAERIAEFTVANPDDLDLLPQLKQAIDTQRRQIRRDVGEALANADTFPIQLRQDVRFVVSGATVFLAEVRPHTAAAEQVEELMERIERDVPGYGEHACSPDVDELEALIPGGRWKYVNQDVLDAQLSYLARLIYEESDVADWLEQQGAKVEIGDTGWCPMLVVRDPAIATYLKLAFWE